MKNKLKKLAMALTLGAAGAFNLSCAVSIPRVSQPLRTPRVYSTKDVNYKHLVQKIDNTLVKHNDPDKLDLEVLVDKHYIDACKKNKKNWWKRIKYNVETHSSKKFKDQFGIEVEIDGVRYITLDTITNDAGYLFTQVRLENDPAQYDACLTFLSRPLEGILGLAMGMGNHALVISHVGEHMTAQHELSHFYGAIDISVCDYNWWNDAPEKDLHPMRENPTIMTYRWGKTDKWNIPNILRIKNNKDRSWKFFSGYVDEMRDHIFSFPKNKQKEVRQLICYSRAFSPSEDAENLAKKLCLEFKNDWKLKYYYSRILKNQHKGFPKIAELYKQIIALKPDAGTLNNIAWNMVYDYGYLEYLDINPLELAKKSVKMDEQGYNLDTLGFIYYKLKDYNKAAQILERAVELSPTLESATNLARVYHKTNNLRDFRRVCQRMFTIEPEEAMVHFNYAHALMDKFADKLTEKQKWEVVDIALRGYKIYPCSTFKELVRDAYLFNANDWEDEEFKSNYEKRIVPILGGTTNEKKRK